jgi:hypothetical protein
MKLLQDVWKLEEAFNSKKDKKILPLSTKEKSTLINPASKAADVKKIAKRMEELALMRMMQLEDENKPNEQQRQTSRHKPFYIGLGVRYNKYKDKAPCNQGAIRSYFKK